MPSEDTNWHALLGHPSGPLLRPAEAANYLGLSLASFYGQVKSGQLPPLIKIGPRAAAIPKPWLDLMIAEKFFGRP